jgi:death-on-curing protein
MDPKFLSRSEVELLHAASLANHGGSVGVRDSGLVDSEIASARNAYFYGQGDLFDVAAAYAYHLAEAQAYLDGNKRTAMLAAIVFLGANDVIISKNTDILYQAMIDIANHKLDKAGLAEIFRRLAQK